MATKFKITKKFQQLIIRTTNIYGPNVTRKSLELEMSFCKPRMVCLILRSKGSFSSLPSKVIALANKEVEKGIQEPWPIQEVR